MRAKRTRHGMDSWADTVCASYLFIDQGGGLLNEQTFTPDDGPFTNGSIVEYVSTPTARPVKFLEVFVDDPQSPGVQSVGSFRVEFTNDCNVAPVLNVGTIAGVFRILDIQGPRVDSCDAATVAPTGTPTTKSVPIATPKTTRSPKSAKRGSKMPKKSNGPKKASDATVRM